MRLVTILPSKEIASTVIAAYWVSLAFATLFFFSFFNFSGENRRAREINKNIRNESYGYTRRLTGCEQFINQMYILTDNDVRQKYRAILFITSLKRNACSTLMSLSFHAISIK